VEQVIWDSCLLSSLMLELSTQEVYSCTSVALLEGYLKKLKTHIYKMSKSELIALTVISSNQSEVST
jgi:hypothetical protein